MIREATTKVIEGGSLTRDEAAAVMTEIMEAACTPAQFGAFVTALRAKGVECSEVEEPPWGSVTMIRLPGGGTVGLYQPKHPTALEIR